MKSHRAAGDSGSHAPIRGRTEDLRKGNLIPGRSRETEGSGQTLRLIGAEQGKVAMGQQAPRPEQRWVDISKVSGNALQEIAALALPE